MSPVFVTRGSMEPWIPDSVQYYTHQADGLNWTRNRRNFINGDDMGLGKTLQTITLFVTDIMFQYGDTLLVICPGSLRSNWVNEIRKFTRCISHVMIDGSPKARKLQYEEFRAMTGPKILIVNYETAANDLPEILSIQWHMKVLDEAHYIKNHKAKRSVAAMSIPATRKLMLTGTPMLNRIAELWSLLHECDPARFPRYHSFINRYCVFGGFKDKQIIGVKNEAELRDHLSQYMIRRLKKDCIDLPAVVSIPRPVDLLPTQRKVYDQIIDELLIEYPDGQIKEMANALTKFLRVKQVCGTTAAIDLTFGDHSAKLDACIEDDTELILRGEKIVIFTQFREIQACYVRRAEELFRHINVYQLHGGIPQSERQGIIDQWSAEPGASIIVCMIQVAGIGLNMTASSECAFLDELYTPGLNQQAVDRLNRIGQTASVNVRRYIARNTLESRIQAILKGKMKLNEDIIDANSALGKLLAKAMQQALQNTAEEEEAW